MDMVWVRTFAMAEWNHLARRSAGPRRADDTDSATCTRRLACRLDAWTCRSKGQKKTLWNTLVVVEMYLTTGLYV